MPDLILFGDLVYLAFSSRSGPSGSSKKTELITRKHKEKIGQSMKQLLLLALTLAMVGCTGQNRPQLSQHLHTLMDEYVEEYYRLNPLTATYLGDNRFNDRLSIDLSESHRQEAREMYTRYTDQLGEIDPDDLDERDQLNYEVFSEILQGGINDLRFDDHLLPVNQMFCLPLLMPMLGSGRSVQPFQTADDYRNFLSRMEDFAVWVDTAIAKMKYGAEIGVVHPRFIMEKALPPIRAQLVDDPGSSQFFMPIRNMPEEFSTKERQELTHAYQTMITGQVIPAYGRLHDFIRDRYIPACRSTIGMSELPGGEAWYRYLARRYTTIDMPPGAIFELGKKEVARIRGEMEKVKKEVGFSGSLKEFFEYVRTDRQFYYSDADSLLNGYRALRGRIEAGLPRLFGTLPEAEFTIQAIEPYRAKKSPPAHLIPATPDGSREAVFYVNTSSVEQRPKYLMEALFIHEAVPGHHFQIAIQMEAAELPKLRRIPDFTAFVEGWALYTEDLGKELGVYRDPYSYFGKLSGEMWRAIRLVVDTGIHTRGWTRDEALAYMLENSATSVVTANAEVDRYIVVPGQALSYKVGQLKIRELRARAAEQLGDRFDIRAFHDEILRDGALPLGVLEAKMDRWLNN
jgi:uncharacterized protein (DUF885 family)